MFVCPNDPGCYVNGVAGNLFAGDFKKIEDLGNGCYKVVCKLLFGFGNSFDVCGVDFLPDDWEKYIVKEHGIQIEIDEEDEEEEVDGICNKHCGELHA